MRRGAKGSGRQRGTTPTDSSIATGEREQGGKLLGEEAFPVLAADLASLPSEQAPCPQRHRCAIRVCKAAWICRTRKESDMPGKILVVDDEPDLELLIRQKFRKQIRDKEFEFVFARNGVDALEKLQTDPQIDLVLADINMPEMDGLTLVEKLDDLNPILRAVIISAYGDMANIRGAMNRGAYDFITKPIDFQDLEITINRTLHHVQQYLQQVARLTDAAAAVEAGQFDPETLDGVAKCGGELGRLARVFQQMAREVYAREQRLKQEVQELRIKIDQARKARLVAEVTESDYFRRLQQTAHALRSRATEQTAKGEQP
jgi:YesN/AraC family two-component response regulator